MFVFVKFSVFRFYDRIHIHHNVKIDRIKHIPMKSAYITHVKKKQFYLLNAVYKYRISR